MDSTHNIEMIQPEKKSLFRRFKARPLVSVLIALLIAGLLSGATVFAFNILTTDSATFRSSINSNSPIRQHLIKVDGAGELIATLTDRTDDQVNRVRFNLSILDNKGAVLQQISSSEPAGRLQVVQVVEPGVYTLMVGSEDDLTDDGASYRLNVKYPKDLVGESDSTSPTLAVATPAASATLSGTFSVSGSAADDTGVEQVSIRIGDNPWISTMTTDNWSVDIDSTQYIDGQYAVSIRATDAAGNELVEIVTVNIANNNPGGSGDSPPVEPGDDTPVEPGDDTPVEPGDDTPVEPGDSAGGTDGLFTENFATASSLDKWDIFVSNGQDFFDKPTSWPGDHAKDGSSCSGPTTTRTVNWPVFNNNIPDVRNAKGSDTAYWCPNGTGHFMTAFKTSGYAHLDFTPKQSFNNVSNVCWDQNITDLGNRKWIQLAVVPKGVADNVAPRLDWTHPAFFADGGPASWGLNLNGGVFLASFTQGTVETFTGGGQSGRDGNSEQGISDKANRYQKCVKDNGNGTVTITQARANGSIHTSTLPGKFPSGEVKVVFQDTSYNPDKAESAPAVNNSYTWHWDSISIK